MTRDITPKGRAVLDAAGIKPKPFPHERPRWKASEQELREFERMADGEELPEQEPPKPKPLPITLGAPTLRNDSQFFGAAGMNGVTASWQQIKDRKCSLIAKWRREHSGRDGLNGSKRSYAT